MLQPATIMLFLSLPAEIRIMIYGNLRTTSSPDFPISRREKPGMGHCSYGFHWKVLATSRTISEEAKDVFYGENDWTFLAGPHVLFDSQTLYHSPLAANLFRIRDVHIRFKLFRWSSIYLLTHKAKDGVWPFQKDFPEICKVLEAAACLKVVKLVWIEAADWNPHVGPELTSDSARQHLQVKIYQGLQPLTYLQPSYLIRKGQVSVHFRRGQQAIAMETAFHNAVDELITNHQSKHVQWKQTDRPEDIPVVMSSKDHRKGQDSKHQELPCK